MNRNIKCVHVPLPGVMAYRRFALALAVFVGAVPPVLASSNPGDAVGEAICVPCPVPAMDAGKAVNKKRAAAPTAQPAGAKP